MVSDAGAHLDDGTRVWMIDALRELAGGGDEVHAFAAYGDSGGRARRGLEGDSACDAIWLTGFECEQEVTGLEVEAADRIDREETGGRAPARIDPRQLLVRDLTRVALAEVETADTQSHAVDEQRCE